MGALACAPMRLHELLDPPAAWLDRPPLRRVAGVALAAAAGLAMYGFSVGAWRSPLMGAYVALKMPLLVAVTLTANGLLNGLLALLLGSGLGLRESLLALLGSFALAAVVLAGLAPVAWWLAWSVGGGDGAGEFGHAAYLLLHTVLIAVAGVVANVRLHRQLRGRGVAARAALGTLFAWLGGNALVGSQCAWLLRPFFGSPGLAEEFLRERAWHGSFFEAVWFALGRLAGEWRLPVLGGVVVVLAIPLAGALCAAGTMRDENPETQRHHD